MAFEFGKIYEVNSEWKQYFDGFGNDYVGYYYVTPEDRNISYKIQKCIVINKNREHHPFCEASIPFNFSDCKLCSLSSTAELKLFKLTKYSTYTDIIEAIVIAKNEEAATKLAIQELWEEEDGTEVYYLGDYFGNLPANGIIMAKKTRTTR
jgi:hypothetical protein